MIPDSLDFILRPVTDEQAEYAAAHTLPAASSPAAGRISEEAVRKGSQAASSVPVWGPTDIDTADLLDLLAETNYPAIPEEERQWQHFVGTLSEVARATGLIDQNAVRPLLRGEIKPQRIGAFYHRAAKAGLIAWTGQWHESDDLDGKNSGKPTRVYRWLGTTT